MKLMALYGKPPTFENPPPLTLTRVRRPVPRQAATAAGAAMMVRETGMGQMALTL